MRKTTLNGAAWVLAAAAATPVLATAGQKPNVVIVVTHDPSSTGGPADRAATPNADAWAKRGVTFTNAYAASPEAGPADHALLTGRYPQRVGIEIDAPATAGQDAPPVEASQPTLAQLLKAAGYATGAFGNEPADALVVGKAGDRGFDEVKLTADPSLEPVATFIGTHAAGPFLAYVSLRGGGAELDTKLAQITSALQAAALQQNTVVVLVRDRQGSPWTLHGEGLRAPWVVVQPGAIPAGRLIQQNVSAVDLTPTILASAGVPATTGRPLDGADRYPLAQNPDGEQGDRPLYWRLGPQYGVQLGDWKLVKAAAGRAGPRLYYLGNDPAETLDLFKQQKQRAAALQTAWDTWNAGNRPPLWTDARSNGQLTASDDDAAADVDGTASGEFGPFKSNDSLQGKKAPAVAGKALEVSADVESDGSDGVIVSQGGTAHGYAIYILDGKLQFAVREGGELTSITANQSLGKGSFKVRATLKGGGKLALLVNGKPVATGEAAGLLRQQPKAGLFVGKSGTGAVGDYPTPGVFGGQVKNLKIKVG